MINCLQYSFPQSAHRPGGLIPPGRWVRVGKSFPPFPHPAHRPRGPTPHEGWALAPVGGAAGARGGELTHQCEGFDPSHWCVAWRKAWNTYFAICMRRRHHVTSSGLGVGILHYIEREDLLGIAIM